MAISATLVSAGHNRLVYLIDSTAAAETLSIESDGGPSPDLLTDSIAGPLKDIFNVRTRGYGLIPPPGVTSDAQARALLLSDDATTLVGPNIPTAICRIRQRTGTLRTFTVDAGRGPTDALAPGLLVSSVAPGADSCYLEIEVTHGIGT